MELLLVAISQGDGPPKAHLMVRITMVYFLM
jgi:hypothetical protein